MLTPLTRLLCSALLALLFERSASGEMRIQVDTHASERQQRFASLVQARLTSISAAFPKLVDLTNVELRVVFREPGRDEDPAVAQYTAALDTITFKREVLGFTNDYVFAAAGDYWEYYESEEIHAEYPIVEVIDDVLWKAMLDEFAEQNERTWPPTDCQSTDLPRRLACQMLVSGVDFFVHSRRTRIFNENRLDRLWPSDLTELQSRGWQRGDREYQDVRVLGGIELIKPLVQEFGAPRVFAYIAQTPFIVEENDLFKSAMLYQRRAREVLGW